MTVAIYIASAKDAGRMIPWGIKFAHADHTDLTIVCATRSKSSTAWTELTRETVGENAVRQAVFQQVDEVDREIGILKEDIASGSANSSDLGRVAIEVREISAPNPEEEFSLEIKNSKITLLLLSADNEISSQNAESNWRKQLFEQAPCETAFLRGPAPVGDKAFQVLVASNGEPEGDTALNRARQLAQSYDLKVDVIFSCPEIDEYSIDLANRNLKRFTKRVSQSEQFSSSVVLAPNLVEAIRSQDLEEYSLVLVGSQKARTIKSVFKAQDANSDESTDYAMMVIRDSVPLASRSWAHFTALVRGVVPQLDREQRVDLLGKLSQTSRFDFDFVALISLSTLIAGLGLIQNSGAVVIGAMLVAPLMSPLMGAGFALIQGNVLLIKSALRSVLLGFALALLIGFLTGLCIPGIDLNNGELSGRTHPRLPDLIIAFVSGIAGAYAIARPNLTGALPGVAIAAALVPPIATSGISLAQLDVWSSLGALLLFLTNIFAIVLGTTFAFWCVGINATFKNNKGKPLASWPRYLFVAFVLASVVLAVLMEYMPPMKENIENESIQPTLESSDLHRFRFDGQDPEFACFRNDLDVS